MTDEYLTAIADLKNKEDLFHDHNQAQSDKATKHSTLTFTYDAYAFISCWLGRINSVIHISRKLKNYL